MIYLICWVSIKRWMICIYEFCRCCRTEAIVAHQLPFSTFIFIVDCLASLVIFSVDSECAPARSHTRNGEERRRKTNKFSKCDNLKVFITQWAVIATQQTNETKWFQRIVNEIVNSDNEFPVDKRKIFVSCRRALFTIVLFLFGCSTCTRSHESLHRFTIANTFGSFVSSLGKIRSKMWPRDPGTNL